jgi:Tfp pilus assembly protein PilO
MLTKLEIVKCVLGLLGALGLAVCGEYLTGDQAAKIKQYKDELSSDSVEAAAKAAAEQQKQGKQLRKKVASWKAVLAKVQKYFPHSPKPPVSNEHVAKAAAVTGVNLIKCDKQPPAIVEWMPPAPPAEGDEEPQEPDEEAIAASMIKYSEDVLQLSMTGDYSGWLEFLAEIEKLGAFYQLKNLKIKTADGKLKIEGSLASYHVLETPADRAPKE